MLKAKRTFGSGLQGGDRAQPCVRPGREVQTFDWLALWKSSSPQDRLRSYRPDVERLVCGLWGGGTHEAPAHALAVRFGPSATGRLG